MDTLLTVLQRLEVKLDALDQRAVPPRLPPQPDPDPNYGRQWEWQPPSWAPEGLLTASTAVTIPSQPFASANGWQQADFLRRGAATQHTSSVSRPPDVYPSTSWDSPFQPHMSLGPQPHDGPPPTSWDRPTKRVGEFHAPRSYWEPSPAFFQQRHLEFAGEGQHGDSFGPSMTSMTSTIPSSWDPPSHRMNFFHHDQRSEWEPSAPRGNPATYTFDPRFGKPRTSWDLPGPCIAPKLCSDRSDWNHSESYGGGGSSQYEYGSSRNHGGGSYSPYSNYEGGYEPNPYESPPPPPRDGYYVPAPQPKPPSYAPPQQLWDSPCSLTTLNDAQNTTAAEREREPESQPSPNAHEKADSSSGDRNSGLGFGKIVAVSGSGQQHGNVYWKTGSSTKLFSLDPKKPLKDQFNDASSEKESPIWMDSSITGQCKAIEKAVGGAMELSNLGSCKYERFMGPPITRIFKTQHEAYKDTERISLVSSFIAFLLIGSYAAIDHTDGAGKILMDVKEKAWSEKIVVLKYACMWGTITTTKKGAISAIPTPTQALSLINNGICSGRSNSEEVIIEVWRRVVIFGLYELAEVYKEFVSPP